MAEVPIRDRRGRKIGSIGTDNTWIIGAVIVGVVIGLIWWIIDNPGKFKLSLLGVLLFLALLKIVRGLQVLDERTRAWVRFTKAAIFAAFAGIFFFDVYFDVPISVTFSAVLDPIDSLWRSAVWLMVGLMGDGAQEIYLLIFPAMIFALVGLVFFLTSHD